MPLPDVGTISTIVAATAAATGPLSALLTLYLTKGTEAWRIRFRERREALVADKEYADNLINEAHSKVVNRLEQELADVKTEFVEVKEELKRTCELLQRSREDHAECKLEQEKLRGDMRELRVYVQRLWDHDKRSRDQILKNQEAILKFAPTDPIEQDKGPLDGPSGT